MIVVYHKNNRICNVISADKDKILFDEKLTIAGTLCKLAAQFPKSKIVWCKEEFQQYLCLKEIDSLFHHNKMMLSYNPNEYNFLGNEIGYVEESPFIKINKKVSYPTWQMSSDVGVIHSNVLIAIKNKIKLDADFDYYLNSVAKIGMPLGLLCYSEPKLFRGFEAKSNSKSVSHNTLFKFVKQHYKTRWTLLLLLNFILNEKKFPFYSFIYAVFFYNRNENIIHLDAIAVNSSLKVVEKASIDVIIPTIGRKKYLYDVLCDLKNQTHLPVNVIIVEQNPLLESVSELDYLQKEEWPFVIKHTFTQQAGVCNARNIALQQLESEWVFLADDDIRIKNDFIESALTNLNYFATKAAVFSCLLEGQKNNYKIVSQTTIFGSGCSIVKKSNLKDLKFNERIEFGYGEDTDFGLQLRNSGTDVIYFPEPSILHLKAPTGGFREKPKFLWSDEQLQPKPSPSVMIVKKTFDTKEQILGYKLVLGLRLFSNKGWRNPIRFLAVFQKQWEASWYWASQLEKAKNE